MSDLDRWIEQHINPTICPICHTAPITTPIRGACDACYGEAIADATAWMQAWCETLTDLETAGE